MTNCSMCGRQIPTGQRTCSMCYGDPGHGRDGYYQAWLNEQRKQYENEQREIEQEEPDAPEEVKNGKDNS